MAERISWDSDEPKKIYDHLMPIFQDQTIYGAQVTRQAMMDWHGKVDWGLFDENEFHVSTRMMYRIAEVMVARDWLELFKKKPYLPFTARREQYRGLTDAMNEVLTYDLDRCHYPQKMNMLCYQMIMGGDAALFPFYRNKKIKVPVPYPEMSKGGKVKMKWVDDIRWDRGLDFKVIPKYSYAIDPSVGYEYWDAGWAMFREYTTVDKVKALLDTLESRKKIEINADMRLDDVGKEVLSALGQGGKSEEDNVYIDHILLPNRYIRMLNGKEILQDVKQNPWFPGKINLIIFKNTIDPNPASTSGVALNTIVGSSAFNYEVSFNALLNMLMQRRNMIMTYNEENVDPEDLIAGSMGARLPRGTNPDDITIQQLPQVPPDFFQLPNMMKAESQDISGVQEFEMGEPPVPVQKPTTMQMVGKNVSTKLGYRYATVYEQPLAQFALHLAVIKDKYKDERELMDLLQERYFNLIVDPNDPNGMTVLDPRRIQGGYYMDFEASVKVAERQETLGSLEKLFNMAANDQFFPPESHIALREMLIRMQPGLDKEKADKLVLPMQQMLQAQAQQGMQGQPMNQAMGGPAEARLGNFGQTLAKPGQMVQPNKG